MSVYSNDYVNDDRDRSLFQVNRKAFVSEEILRLERERIFDSSWLYVGHDSEIPNTNDFVTRDVGGRSIIFNRDRNGTVNVLLNTCPHRGASVCRDLSGNAKIFTCFYHGWAYRNSGELVNVPLSEDYANEPATVYGGLTHPAQVEAYRGLWFLNYSDQAPDLRTNLGDAAYLIDLLSDQSPQGVRILEGTHKYTLKANWKLLVENSIDGYHAKSVHHTYFEMMIELGMAPPMLGQASVNGVPPAGVGTEYGNGHTTLLYPANGLPLATQPVKATLAQLRRQIEELHGEEYATAVFGLSRNSVFFPSLIAIELGFGFTLRTMYPLAPDETEVNTWQVVPIGVDEEFLRYRVDNSLTFWGPAGLATPDDVEALEQAQRGFSASREVAWSDISKGMGKPVPAANDELQMRGWWRRWNELITGDAYPAEVEPLIPFARHDVPA